MKKQQTKRRILTVVAIATGLLISTDLFPQGLDLLNAVSDNDIGKVKELIAAGADVNQQDDMMGYTPLGLTNNIEMMKVLISGGANLNHKDKRMGYTILMSALNSCNTEVAEFLIKEGADINLKSNDGTTALILACGCSEDIARLLLEKGADVHAVTDRGMGAFTQCTGIGLKREVVTYEFAEFLLEKGADIDETNTTDYYGGYTPLFWAVESNKEKLVSFLVEHGANINAKSNKGKTPLSIATEAGFTNIVEILKANGAK
jgi:ankyrin repeat protein